jgi:hypothetical protein
MYLRAVFTSSAVKSELFRIDSLLRLRGKRFDIFFGVGKTMYEPA